MIWKIMLEKIYFRPQAIARGSKEEIYFNGRLWLKVLPRPR